MNDLKRIKITPLHILVLLIVLLLVVCGKSNKNASNDTEFTTSELMIQQYKVTVKQDGSVLTVEDVENNSGKTFTGANDETANSSGKENDYYLNNGEEGAINSRTVRINGVTYHYLAENDGEDLSEGKRNGSFASDATVHGIQTNDYVYTNTFVEDNGSLYYYGVDGQLKTGFQNINGETYYFTQGVMQTGWVEDGGNHYYFQSNGEMVKNKIISIEKSKYKFDANGVQVPMSVTDIGTTMNGHHSFVYNYTDGVLMYSDGNMYDTVYPASTTKILTCAIALSILDPDEMVTLGDEVYMCAEYASRARLPVGGRVSVKDMVAGVMIPSGSDVAWALAYHAGKKLTNDQNLSKESVVQIFMDELNQRGKEMGLVHTYYVAPDGYPDADEDGRPDTNHYTCMADTIKIACLAIETPWLYEVVGMARYKCTVPEYSSKYWSTCIPFLEEDSRYYDPNVTGLKTGTTSIAGCCIVVTIEYEGKLYIIGTFGSSETDGRFQDVCALKDYFVYGKN